MLRRKRIGFWVLTATVLVVDLASKEWAFDRLQKLAPGIDHIKVSSFLWLSQHVNRGMVFSLWSGKRLPIILLTSLLIPAIVLVAYQCRDRKAPLWALGVLLGGAAGNLYDRVFYRHSLYEYGVRDFLDLRNPWTGENLWPVFNVADIAIVIGVFTFVGWSLFLAPAEEKTSDDEPEPAPQEPSA